MKNFLTKYSGLTHTLASFWALVVTAYASSADFRNAVNTAAMTLYHSLPAGAASAVSAAAAILVPLWAFYRNGQKQGGNNGGSGIPAAMLAFVLPLLMATMLSLPVVALTGCTQQQKISVAQAIVNFEPAVQAGIDTAASSLALVDPAAAPVLAIVVTASNAFLPQFKNAASAYLANPNQTNLELLQSTIAGIQGTINAQLLAAAKITNPTSQAKVITDINGIGTIIAVILGLVQTVSSKAQLAAMSRQTAVKFAMVRSLMDTKALEAEAVQINEQLAPPVPVTVDGFFQYEADHGF